jgi:hypothetical protein
MDVSPKLWHGAVDGPSIRLVRNEPFPKLRFGR